jgi:hypothetical protein
MKAEKTPGVIDALGLDLGPVTLSAEQVEGAVKGYEEAKAGEGVTRGEFREEMEQLLNRKLG